MKLRSVVEASFFGLEGLMLEELKKLGLENQEIQDGIEVFELLKKALKPEEELLGEHDYIAEGYSEKIDKLRKIAYHSDETLLQYQQDLVEATGITNIKLKFIMNQGYFLELTRKDSEAFEGFLKNQSLEEFSPEQQAKWNIVRRQTLKGSQRYTSPYLDELEGHIL